MSAFPNFNHDIENASFPDMNFSAFSEIWGMKPVKEVAAKGAALGLLVLLSLTANGIVIYVVSRTKKLRTPTNLFILNVAVADFLTSCYTPWAVLISDSFQNWQLGPVLCRADGFLEITCLLASVFSLTVISFDRLLGIVYPFHRRLDKMTARIIILAVWMAAMGIATPFIFFRTYKVRQWADYTEIFCSEDSRQVNIYWIVILSVMVWLPLSAMSIAYTFIIMKLDRYKKLVARIENFKQVHHRRRVIRMLYIILIVFFICWLPFQILVFYRSALKSIDASSNIQPIPKSYKVFFFAAHYIAFCSCLVNPIVYSLTNQKFRRAFLEHCICVKKKKQTKPNIKLIYKPDG